MEASQTALGVILSQVQDLVKRPKGYASRQENQAEHSFSVSESEILALVWATKHFRCYLLGRLFVVRTFHAALVKLQNFADNNSRLLRWSIKLSELDFVVQQRPGSKLSHIDSLSRHVRTVTHVFALDK
jgi:hypothetical protein